MLYVCRPDGQLWIRREMERDRQRGGRTQTGRRHRKNWVSRGCRRSANCAIKYRSANASENSFIDMRSRRTKMSSLRRFTDVAVPRIGEGWGGGREEKRQGRAATPTTGSACNYSARERDMVRG